MVVTLPAPKWSKSEKSLIIPKRKQQASGCHGQTTQIISSSKNTSGLDNLPLFATSEKKLFWTMTRHDSSHATFMYV